MQAVPKGIQQFASSTQRSASGRNTEISRSLAVTSTAPISQAWPCGRVMPRWSVAGQPAPVPPSRRAAGQQHMGRRVAAVDFERAKQGIDAVATGAEAAGLVAGDAEAAGRDRLVAVEAGFGTRIQVAGQQRVGQRERAQAVGDPAGEERRRVARNRRVDQRDAAAALVEPPPPTAALPLMVTFVSVVVPLVWSKPPP